MAQNRDEEQNVKGLSANPPYMCVLGLAKLLVELTRYSESRDIFHRLATNRTFRSLQEKVYNFMCSIGRSLRRVFNGPVDAPSEISPDNGKS